jgi:hypothetical protein
LVVILPATAHHSDWYLLLSYYCPGYLASTITFLRVYTREVPAAYSIQLIHQLTVNAYALFEVLHIVLHQEDYNHGNEDIWNNCPIPILISHLNKYFWHKCILQQLKINFVY